MLRFHILLVFLVLSTQPAIAEPDPNLWIFGLIGQSNMVGAAYPGSAVDYTGNPRILAYKNGSWELAVEPLHNSRIGPGFSFARELLPYLPEEVRIGLVPCAVGNTALYRWEKGGDCYTQALTKISAAATSGTLKGLLWHQGEGDATYAGWASTYETRLSQMVSNLRGDLGLPNLPFACGQIGQVLLPTSTFPCVEQVNTALRNMPTRLSKVACVSSMGLTMFTELEGTYAAHFDVPSQHLLGERYAAAMRGMILPTAAAGDSWQMYY